MKHPVVLAVSLVSLVSLALIGCGDDRAGHHGGSDCQGSDNDGSQVAASCEIGVSFDLGALDTGIEAALPVRVKACFDRDCDVLTIVEQNGRRSCTGAPGGPLDQLTSCQIGADGKVAIHILRVDDADYADGQPHTAAISLQNQQGLIVDSFAKSVTFLPNQCGLQSVKLDAP
jgi:hypothetical protein